VDMNRTTAALLRDMHGVDGLDELKQYAQAVQETLLEEAMQQAVVAIGEPKHTLLQLGESYQEARRAMEVGQRFEPEETVFLYSRLILDRFLDTLPREDCQYYFGLLFNRRTAKLFNEEMLQTIEMFFRKDLNLSDTARQLFIHRNTLVYRLDKVQRLTGLDLRRFDDAMTFRILYKLKRCLQDKPARQP
jgi:carbohydrate diacid regulator